METANKKKPGINNVADPTEAVIFENQVTFPDFPLLLEKIPGKQEKREIFPKPDNSTDSKTSEALT